ncbi:MAG: Uma2 family endonuclease [Gammaproteobacteria bacterium]
MQTATQTASPQVHGGQPSSPDHCILLSGVRWETYESLLADMQDGHAAHFAYDRGVLEIMAPSYEHDNLKHIIAVLVEFLAGEMEIDIEGGGSTTFRRKDLARGFEPDECFYIQHAERVRGKKQIDLAQDPPPDLIIEIDISSPSLNKLPMFAALGIPEVWRHDGARVAIFTLADNDYVERAESAVLPKVTSAILTEFIDASRQLKRPAWLRRVRAWARSSFESDR